MPGDTLDAVVLQRPQDWRLAWDEELNPTGIVIVQSDDIRFHVACIRTFLETQHWRRPSLLYVDEGHDFYGPTGMALHGDAIQKCFRAGAEQGMTSLLGMQRPKTVNLQILTEANVCYLFHIKFKSDLKRLAEMGMEVDDSPADESYRFRYFRGSSLHPKELKIRVKERAA